MGIKIKREKWQKKPDINFRGIMVDIFDELSNEETGFPVSNDPSNIGKTDAEQRMEEVIGPVPTLRDIFSGKTPETPATSLIKKRPSELIRRPIIGIFDLMQSLNSPSQMIQRGPSFQEAVRGDISNLSSKEQEAGKTLESLTQLVVPLPFPKGTGVLKDPKPVLSAVEKITDLKLPKIAEEGRELSKFLKPKALSSSIKKEELNLLKQGEKILDDVKKSKFNLVKQIEAGKPIEDITIKQFKKITADAEKFTDKIKVDEIINSIQKNIYKFSKARTPAATEKQAISVGKELIKDLEKGDLSMSELVAQYRSNNKASKTLIQKAFTQGSSPESLQMYQSANDAIAKQIQANPEATTLFKFFFKQSNANFNQLKKIDQYESIMKSAINEKGVFEPKKLLRTLQDSKKTRELSKIIGTNSVNDLRKMSTKLVNATDSLSKIKPLNLKDIFSATPLLLKYLGLPGSKAIGVPIMAKKGVDVAYGYYLMKPQSQNLISKLTSAVKSKNYDLAKKTALKLEIGFNKAQSVKKENNKKDIFDNL